MSADNGIYILVTAGSEEGVREYRVAHAQAIENLSWQPDIMPDTPAVSCQDEYCEDDHHDVEAGINSEYARMLFGKSTVFTDRASALGAAADMYELMDGYVEYGICFLDHANVRFPDQARDAAAAPAPVA